MGQIKNLVKAIKRLITSIKQFEEQVQSVRGIVGNDAEDFAYWLSNNWYKPWGEAGEWALQGDNKTIYSTQYLYKKFKEEKYGKAKKEYLEQEEGKEPELKLNKEWFNSYNDYEDYYHGEDEYIDGLLDMQKAIYKLIWDLHEEGYNGMSFKLELQERMRTGKIKPPTK